MIKLTLPYPISANKYWRPVHVGNHITIVPTKDAICAALECPRDLPRPYGEWLAAPAQHSMDFMLQYPAERLAMVAEPLPPKAPKAPKPPRAKKAEPP